jgi:hypothetical protein
VIGEAFNCGANFFRLHPPAANLRRATIQGTFDAAPAISYLNAAEPSALFMEYCVASRHRVRVGVRFDQFDALNVRVQIQAVAAIMHGTPHNLEAGVRATPCSDGEIVSLSRRRPKGDVGDVRSVLQRY